MQRWPRFLLLVVAACGSAAPSPAANQGTTPAPAAPTAPAAEPDTSANADRIAQIDAFLADPTRVDAAPIAKFVIESSAVSVEVHAEEMIGLIEEVGLDERASGLLLIGFIAGNARAQLVKGVKQDDFVAGMRGLVKVYGGIQASVPALDEAAAAERGGTLEAWAAAWRERHTAK